MNSADYLVRERFSEDDEALDKIGPVRHRYRQPGGLTVERYDDWG